MHGASDAGNPFTRRHDQDDIQSRSGTGSSALSAIAVNVGGQTVTVRVPSSPAFGRAPACKLPRLHVGTPVTQGIVATSGTEVTVGVRVDAPARVGLLIEDFVVPHRFRVYLTSRNMVTGSGTIAWNGRIAGAPLWPGSYLLVLRGARGCRRATPVAVPLEVTRPPRP